MALFVHMGCIAFDIFKKTNRPLGYVALVAVSGLGVYVTWLLLMMYSGHFYRVDAPDAYSAMFTNQPVTETVTPGSEK